MAFRVAFYIDGLEVMSSRSLGNLDLCFLKRFVRSQNVAEQENRVAGLPLSFVGVSGCSQSEHHR